LEAADSASRKAVELAPKLAEARASRGVALSTLRNYPDAQKEFRAAIRLNPSLYEAHYFYGRACLAQGKYEQAIEPFESQRRCGRKIIKRSASWEQLAQDSDTKRKLRPRMPVRSKLPNSNCA